MLNLNDPGSLDMSKIKEIAMKWLTICDTDGDGEISLKEFKTFFLAMDGIFLSESEIEELFIKFDVNNSGDLSIEEFANAIKSSVALDQPDSDGEDDIDVNNQDNII